VSDRGSYMRNVKVAAIQPGYLPTSDAYDCLGEHYVRNVDEIIEHYVKKQLEITLGLVEQAGRQGCGIVTTCEDACATSGFGMDMSEGNIFAALLKRSAELVEEGLSKLARKYSMYVVGCYNKRVGGGNYNTATVFDRQGYICGEYRKTHLPAYEKWQVTEGDALNVIETDFGKIGVCICYDMMFPECVQVEALSGAEIIFHPTAGYGWYDSIGEATLRTRANDNSVYIVTSKNWVNNAAGKSSIIDYWGQVLCDAGFYRDVIVTHEIDLDVPKAQPDWYYPTWTSGIPNMRERNLRERRPELYTSISQNTHERLGVPDEDTRQKIIQAIKAGRCRW
jgi:predicted amidohydrolase